MSPITAVLSEGGSGLVWSSELLPLCKVDRLFQQPNNQDMLLVDMEKATLQVFLLDSVIT